MRNLFILILILSSSFLFGQQNTGSHSYNNGFVLPRTNTTDNINVDNTPYLYLDWKPAIIEMFSGNNIDKPTKVMLDIVNDKIFVDLEGNKTFEIQPADINKLTITNEEEERNFVSKKINEVEERNDGRSRLYEVLFEHKDLIILQKNTKTYASKASQNTYSGQGSRISDFINKTTYHLKYKDGPFQVVKINKKYLIEIFPRKEKWIKKYIKENKIDLRDPKDLNQLLNKLLEA